MMFFGGRPDGPAAVSPAAGAAAADPWDPTFGASGASRPKEVMGKWWNDGIG